MDNPQEVELAIAGWKITDQKAHKYPSIKHLQSIMVHLSTLRKILQIDLETAKIHGITKKHPAAIRRKCQMSIAAAKGSLSVKIDISTQTGLRPIEIQDYKGLKARDIHFDQNCITPLNTKGCATRPPLRISEELAAKLKTYITARNLQPEDFLFSGNERRYGETYRRFSRLAGTIYYEVFMSL